MWYGEIRLFVSHVFVYEDKKMICDGNNQLNDVFYKCTLWKNMNEKNEESSWKKLINRLVNDSCYFIFSINRIHYLMKIK